MEDDNSIENPTTPVPEHASEESEYTYTISELRIAQVFVLLITIGLFILIVGGVWAIADLFSTNKLQLFIGLSLFTQIFILGVMFLGLFVAFIFLVVFYRRGRDALLRSLFQLKIRNKNVEEYLPARIISFGVLISIIAVLVSAGVFGIQLLMIYSSGSRNNFLNFLIALTGGVRMLLIGVILIALVLFALAFIYFWNNGYYFIVTRILRRNEKIGIPIEFTKTQKNIGRGFFILFVAIFISIIYGIAWAIGDFFQTNGKFSDFLNASLGIELLIISLIALTTFTFLIVAMLFYKSGNLIILKAIFYKKPLPVTNKDYFSAKIIAIGIMLSFFLMIIALITWLFSEWFTYIGTSINTNNFFENIFALAGGERLLTITFIIFAIVSLILIFIYIGHNGYALLVQRIIDAQDKLDKHLETESKIHIAPKQEKVKAPKPPKEPKSSSQSNDAEI